MRFLQVLPHDDEMSVLRVVVWKGAERKVAGRSERGRAGFLLPQRELAARNNCEMGQRRGRCTTLVSSSSGGGASQGR